MRAKVRVRPRRIRRIHRFVRFVPFGYRLVSGRLVKEAGEQRVLREIANLAGCGISLRSMAKRLADRGYLNKGQRFRVGTLAQLVTRVTGAPPRRLTARQRQPGGPSRRSLGQPATAPGGVTTLGCGGWAWNRSLMRSDPPAAFYEAARIVAARQGTTDPYGLTHPDTLDFDAITVEEARVLMFAMEMERLPRGSLVPVCQDGGRCVQPGHVIELGNGEGDGEP